MDIRKLVPKPTLEKTRYRFLLFVLFYIIQIVWNFYYTGFYVWALFGVAMMVFLSPVVAALYILCEAIVSKSSYLSKNKYVLLFLSSFIVLSLMQIFIFTMVHYG